MTTRDGAVMKRLLGLMMAALLTALPAAAQDFLVGARPLGMGSAYTAQEGDANCVPWNPAGLASVNSIQFTSMYADLYQLSFLKESNFSVAVPLGRDRGVAGLGYSALSIDYDYPSYFNLNTLSWRDSEFRLSYARPLNSAINVGATFNWLSTTSNVEGGEMKKYSFDLGGQMRVLPQLTVGAALLDLASHRTWDGSSGAESSGVGYRVGGLYRFDMGLRVALDAYGNSQSDDSLDGLALGFEYPLYYRASEQIDASRLRTVIADMQELEEETAYNITLRTGLNHMFSGSEKNRLTLGGSFGMGMGTLDYAFIYDKDNLGNTHVVSLGLDFGRPSWHKQLTESSPAPARYDANIAAAARAAAPQPQYQPVQVQQPVAVPRAVPAQPPAQTGAIFVPPLPADGSAGAGQPAVYKVAILPFVNVSRNERLYWLSDGMVDILAKEFAPYPNVEMIPKATVLRAAEGLGLRFTGEIASQDIRTIGVLLGADKVVVGNYAEGTGTVLNIYSRVYDTNSGMIKGYQQVSDDVINIFTMSRTLATRIKDDLTK